jgi:mono/diheme cytochrome c family protein
MFKGLLHLHVTSVVIFLILYAVKTFLLMTNRSDSLLAFTKKTKVIEMIISTIFLVTGIYLWVNSGNTGTWLYVKVAAVLISIPMAIIGFRKQNKFLAFASFLLLVYAYGVAETKSASFSKKPDPRINIDTALKEADLGREVYNRKCTACHGEDGTLGLSGATDLSKSALDSASIVDIVRNGKGVMTPFKDILSEKEIQAVSRYIISLRK